MEKKRELSILLALGPLAAMLLGIYLIPYREYTSASNFAFVFLILVLAVAAYGGRLAAVFTALVSSLSLDFFLTKPYMRLEIAEKHDLFAFLGLTICGLIAAYVGSRRGLRG